MDPSDFRIPDTPRMERSRGLFNPGSAPSFRRTGGNDQLSSWRQLTTSNSEAKAGELEIDTTSNSSLLQEKPVSHSDQRLSASVSRLHQRTRESPRASYFSSLTQKFQNHEPDPKARPSFSGHMPGSDNTVRLSGEVISYSSLGKSLDHQGNQSQETGNQIDNSQQSSHSQTVDVAKGFRGIQDAITTRFQDLEKKLQLQEQEITELKFSLNDANVMADRLEADKRQLRHKNEDLERKLKLSDERANDLRKDILKGQSSLEKSAVEQDKLRQCVERASQKADQDQKALEAAQNKAREMRLQVEETQRELRESTLKAIERSKEVAESADSRLTDLTQQLRRRDADMAKLQEANKQLSAQLDNIPERNFQALSTCVKKILGKLDDAQSDILSNGKAANQQHQEQHEAMVGCLKGLLTASQQHVEALATSQQETEGLSRQLLEKIDAYYGARSNSETTSRSELQSAVNRLQKCFETSHCSLTESFTSKIRESDTLADLCQRQETDNKALSTQLLEQLRLSQGQLHEIQQLHQALRKLEEAPRENPDMVAKILLLQEQSRRFEAQVNEKDAQITRLEESYKERTRALISTSEKFAADLQQLTSTFQQREEEYRRSVDQASDLATREINRTLDENKQEIQRELQQERTRRQGLEKELRQAKQDLSVTEEKSRRDEQSIDTLQKDLAAAKLGGQVVTTHLQEKTRALESQVDHDSTVITQLKAALTDKEMDYVNLRSSMEAYDEKVRVLVERLRGWAQDYTHIAAIRSCLEMLSQIDQSCAATAQQYYARQNERDAAFDFGAVKAKASPLSYSPDESHEQRISELSAFLNADVAVRPEPSHVEEGGKQGNNMAAAIIAGRAHALKTPGNGLEMRSSGIKPPPVLKDRVIAVSLDQGNGIDRSSPLVVSSPVPKRPRRETRASIAQKAAMRNPVSPSNTTTTRRSKRKRPAADTAEADAETALAEYAETSVYFHSGEQGQKPTSAGGAGMDAAAMASSPQNQ